jgi:two-component system chemotaxis response regulator CheB
MSLPEAASDSPIRLLIVDDSAFVRYTLSQRLAQVPGLQVVGVARDGAEALALIPELQPQVITLDVEMPRMDGLTALQQIMARFPRPVIMLSSLTSEGARETIQALTWGAVDFILKPAQRANIEAILPEVVSKIQRAARARIHPLAPPRLESASAPQVLSKARRPLRQGERVVVIGASTGGPRALNTVLSMLPPRLPAALLVVQHMPPGFTRSLAERLDTCSHFMVKEAAPGDVIEVGQALVAPGGYHMTVNAQGQIALNQNPPLHGVRPAVDVTMASVAQRYGAAAVAVVLTGMGNDGTQGATLIRNCGGRVIAEDESSCVVWGMPRSVVEAGLAHEVVPLARVAEAIEKAVG